MFKYAVENKNFPFQEVKGDVRKSLTSNPCCGGPGILYSKDLYNSISRHFCVIPF